MRHKLSVDPTPVTSPRFRTYDLIREALLSIAGHPARALFTAVGNVLGAAAFVATLGLSSTLSQQVSAAFDVHRATEVTVRSTDDNFNPHAPTAAAGDHGRWLTPPALAQLERLAGVESVGRRVTVPNIGVDRFAEPGVLQVRTSIVGLDSDTFTSIRPRITTGRTFDEFHDRTGTPVVMLPSAVARDLGVTLPGGSVFIRNRAFTVIGIFDEVVSRPETMLGVVMPYQAALPITATAGSESPKYDIIIKTVPGAAQLIGRQAPLALAPQNPQSLRAVAPPDPQTLRMQVQDEVTQFALVLSIVSLAIGAVSIGNSATAGIAARIPEIGLRRAVGARPIHVFAQLLSETTLLGTLGGCIGALLGVLITVGVSLFNAWQPVVDLRMALLATGGGALAGLLAGLMPAFRAMRIEPVAALQR